MMTARESPSGKASAFQADIRGFESRLPLLFILAYAELARARGAAVSAGDS